MCRLFDEVEEIVTLNKHCYQMLLPIPTHTYFPHRNYSSLNELMDKLNAEYAAVSDLIVWEEPTAPETLSVGMKVRVKYVDDEYSDDDDDDDETDETNEEFEDATIEKVNDDETFDIVYDYDFYGARKNVSVNEIQIQNVRYFITCFPFRVLHIVCFAHNSSFLYLLSFTYINRKKASRSKRKRTKKSVSNLF
jgi:hypothetical protein